MLRGLLHPACGPLLRVELRSESGSLTGGLAIIDTGASRSAIDKHVARTLELPTFGAATWFAVSSVEKEPDAAALRRATIRLADDPRLWELDLIEVPNLSEAVEGYWIVALLGWDFLDQCKLVCDGPAGTFTLELPRPRSTGRRRR